MKNKLIRLLELFTTLCIYALVLCGFCVLVIALTSIYLRLFPKTDIALIAVLVLLTLLFIGVCVIGYVLLSDKKGESENEKVIS